MLRCLTKLRCLAVQSRQILPPPSSRRLLHHLPSQPLHSASTFRTSSPPSFVFSSWPLHVSHPCPSLVQVRHVSSRERKLRRKPMTPTISKVKKTKMKSYSSLKLRFREMSDGNFRRWKEGKRHNAHLKSKKSKRRLRKPGIVPAAYAKVMKKLNFSV
ncbi:hypothetical protein PHAVU_002G132700 [Phaseolus vulgaris]|uniref:50S ribosomal protein L35 n=1 Tax=Phaseolus vulgaris TaxID=3885 RepID=V7CMS9_PHAVU|nr:hypothetical protein PHAVU_002G132700g [Phaseolus vulgaris]ESW30196.1 hypothetical protein PHAVU_002G132700g [Phaseolus vulgaris]